MYISELELWLLATSYLLILVLIIGILYEYDVIHKKLLSITADRNKYAQRLYEVETSISHLISMRSKK